MTERRIFHQICIVFWILLFPVLLFSQTKNPIKLGLKLSPNLGWYSPSTKDYSAGKVSVGATIGFVSEFYFTERYAVTTGLNFSFLNGNLEYPENLMVNNDTLTGTMKQKIKTTYLEVPLMIKMNTKMFGDFSFYGQAGFAAGFNLSSTASDNFTSNQGNTFTEKKDFGDQTTLMRGSVSIGIGAEYHLDTSTRIFLDLTYSNALNNVLKGQNNITHTNVKAWLNYLALNVGVLF
jgi:hypothetical protein